MSSSRSSAKSLGICKGVSGSARFVPIPGLAVAISSCIVLITSTVSSVASAQQKACERNDFGMFEDFNCAVAARDKADQELNVVYQRLLSNLEPADAIALRKAQRAWLAFVSADSDFSLTREGNGSSGRLVAVNNRERLTRERIAALKARLTR